MARTQAMGWHRRTAFAKARQIRSPPTLGDTAHNDELKQIVDGIARVGSTPLVVAETQTGSNRTGEQARVLGVIELKDIVKGGMRARFDELRKMGIRTIMITGDNPLTAAAIAKESGVD